MEFGHQGFEMHGFEERLSRAVGSVLGLALLLSAPGCTGTDKASVSHSGDPVDLSGACSGAPLPTDYQLSLGFVEIASGGTCPDASDAQLQVNSCTFLEWQNITCGFDRVALDQIFVDDGYGGLYVDADSQHTGGPTGPVVDVCYYEGVFYLDPNHPTCGRPLLREGDPVVAEVRPGASAWSGPAAFAAVESTAAERATVAAWWLRSAMLEHASVASFSVFSLDLMRLGAPPELLRDTHRAALDEIEHARLCFGLASSFHGAPLAPGPLDSHGLGVRTREEIAVALLREGCIGETLAALDAAARLAHASEPAVVAALQVIVRDESEHAALAWRALRWILAGESDGALLRVLERVLEEERTKWTTGRPETGPVSPAMVACGLLPDRARDRAWDRGWDDVIGPSWAALTG